MGSRAAYLARRIGQAAFVMAAVVVVSFFLIRLAPGDAALALAGQIGYSDPKVLADLRREFGLDRSLAEQFAIYIGKLATGDLGLSYQRRQPVLDLILERLPATLLLASAVITFSLVLGVAAGALAARRPGGWLDATLRIVATALYAMPSYWLGLVLVLLFAVRLGWLPAFGTGSLPSSAPLPARLVDGAVHLVLPALTLGLFFTAIYSRLTRAAMLEVAGLDFVKTARAKGISERRVLTHHVLRNALIPVVTYAGLQTSALVGGTVLVETVYSWPGIGRLAYEALIARDNNLLLGIFVFTSALVVLFNLFTDLLTVMLDPRTGLIR